MGKYVPDKFDIDMLLNQRTRDTYSRFEIFELNSNMFLGNIEGETISCSVSSDADSDIRNILNSTILIRSSGVAVNENSKIWMNRKIHVFVGIKIEQLKSIRWYDLGWFIFNSNGFTYNATENTIQVSCIDYMGLLDGTLAGELTGIQTEIPQGSIINEVLETTIQQLGEINSYRIDYPYYEVPYDMKFGTGSSVLSIVKEVKDLYYPYEVFFEDETFVCQEIPNLESDPVSLDYSILDKLVISENTSHSFSEIKNCIEIFGKSLTSNRYSGSCVLSGDTFYLELEGLESTEFLVDGETVGFIATDYSPVNLKISINNETPLDVLEDGKPLEQGKLVAGVQYIVRYSNTDGLVFKFVGQSQIHAMAKLVQFELTPEEIKQDQILENCFNIRYVVIPNSPYCIEKIGRYNKVYSGGEFDLITTDSLAAQRAEYENWKQTRLTDSVSINTIYIPWLRVNQKISYTLRSNKNITQEPQEYIIKRITSSPLDSTMTIDMIRFYPFYPYIIKQGGKI